MLIHLCKGSTQCAHEILHSYAGIIRIRFMGIISATVARAPLQWRKDMNFFYYSATSSCTFRLSGHSYRLTWYTSSRINLKLHQKSVNSHDVN